MKTSINTLFTIAFCTIASLTLNAQQTGKVDYKFLGVSFTIPNGWIGQEAEGMFIIGSNTTPGIILVTTHESTTLEQLKQEATVGMNDGQGTQLTASGSIENIGSDAIGVNMAGTLEWQAAKGYAIGVINPHGTGVLIMALSTPQQYSETLTKAAKQVKNSLSFRKPETGPIVQQWKSQVGGRRLTHMNSYYSPSYTDGGISGGYSDKVIIELCNNGSFTHSSSYTMSASGSNASVYDSDQGYGDGKWKITVNGAGQPILQLNFYKGEVYSYDLTFQDEYLHMNGKKYFRTALEGCQ
ncbi:MAG: hypothetical protein AAFO07_08270 [Bacteroidota bacterium]